MVHLCCTVLNSLLRVLPARRPKQPALHRDVVPLARAVPAAVQRDVRRGAPAGAAGRALGVLPVQRPDFYYRRTRDTRRMDGARPRSYAYRPGDHLRHRELRTIAPRGANRTFQNRTFIQLMHISPTYLHICYFPAHPHLHISQRLSRCTNV